jgi:Skp family chaperone for outer membrane proteins
MSVEARLALQKNIERLNLEIQRMSQDAEADMADLQQTLQLEFQKRLVPEIEKLAAEKQLHFIFSAEGGLIWADRALDLTDDIIQRLNGPTP